MDDFEIKKTGEMEGFDSADRCFSTMNRLVSSKVVDDGTAKEMTLNVISLQSCVRNLRNLSHFGS